MNDKGKHKITIFLSQTNSELILVYNHVQVPLFATINNAEMVIGRNFT